MCSNRRDRSRLRAARGGLGDQRASAQKRPPAGLAVLLGESPVPTALLGGLARRAEAVGLTGSLANLGVRFSALGRHDDAFPAQMGGGGHSPGAGRRQPRPFPAQPRLISADMAY